MIKFSAHLIGLRPGNIQCFLGVVKKIFQKFYYITIVGEKPYKCTQCDYKCRQPKNLTEHKRKHTGKNPSQ